METMENNSNNVTKNFTGHFTNSPNQTNNATYQLINSNNNINFTANSNNNSRINPSHLNRSANARFGHSPNILGAND